MTGLCSNTCHSRRSSTNQGTQGTKQLSLQIDHHKYAEDLTSPKQESRNRFAAYTTICFYWQMPNIRLNNLSISMDLEHSLCDVLVLYLDILNLFYHIQIVIWIRPCSLILERNRTSKGPAIFNVGYQGGVN